MFSIYLDAVLRSENSFNWDCTFNRKHRVLIVSQVMGGMRPASAASDAIEAEVSLKVWDILHGTLSWALEADIGRVRPASATSEAIKAEILRKVWKVLHPRAVGEGVRRAQCSGLRVISSGASSALSLHEQIRI